MKGKFQYRGSYFSYAITYFSYFFAMGTIVNMLSIYLTDGLGKTDQEMSFIVSASSLFGIITNPVIGYLNDKFRKPKILAASLLSCAAVFALVFTVCRNTFVLYLLNGLIMGSISAVSPISERVASSGKYRYGQIRIWGTIGFAAAPQVAGVIMEIAAAYWMFIAAAVSLVIGAVSYLLLTGISFEMAKDEEKAPEEKAGNRLAFLKMPMFVLFACIAMIYAGVAALNNAYCPILLQSLGLSTSTVGTVISISVLVELPIVLFSNHYMDRFSSKTLAAASLGMMLLQFLFYSFCKNVIVVLIAMVLLKAVCGTLFMMVQLKVIRGVVGEDSVSTAQGGLNSANSLATIVIQNAGGWLAGAFGIQSLYFGLSALTALALVLCMFLKVKNTEKFFS